MENKSNSQIIYKTLDTSIYKISKVEAEKNISKKKEITFKLIIIGDVAVGKSSIIQSLVKGKDAFKENYKATIGFDISKYKSKVKDIIINLNIWDTCGLIDFTAYTPSLFKDAVLAIVVYDITKRKSFENVQNWINKLKNNSSPDVIIFIVGNKVDLESEREIKVEETINYVKENNYNLFFETSAKNHTHIQELFDQANAHLYEYYRTHNESEDKDDNDVGERENFGKKHNIALTNKNHNIKKNQNCC